MRRRLRVFCLLVLLILLFVANGVQAQSPFSRVLQPTCPGGQCFAPPAASSPVSWLDMPRVQPALLGLPLAQPVYQPTHHQPQRVYLFPRLRAAFGRCR